jgi:hypothetical protein
MRQRPRRARAELLAFLEPPAPAPEPTGQRPPQIIGSVLTPFGPSSVELCEDNDA